MNQLNLRILLLTFILSYSANAQFGFVSTDSIDIEVNGENLKHPWIGGLSHCQFSNFDANFDGVQDLLVFDKSDETIHVFIRKNTIGDVNFEYVDSLSNFFPRGIKNWILMRDFNCDGLKDIFTFRPGGIMVYKNTSQNGELKFEVASNELRCYYGPPPNNNSNVHVAPDDIPGIEDIDGDGDLDILSFGSGMNSVVYYKNMSMEDYGVCDSLNMTYVNKNECWGHFSEDNNNNQIELNSSYWYCQNTVVPNPELSESDIEEKNGRHVGSTILPIDINGSGVYDLVLGDISFDNLVLLTNDGVTPNTNSPMISADYNFPSNTTPVSLENFPAAFYVDVTNDNVRDLLVSTHLPELSEDIESISYYENIGTDASPNFILRSESFLQEEMIENGSKVYPVFFDHNQDGLQDLIVGNYRRYIPNSSDNYTCKIQYYENIGTATQPKFKFITDDYQNLESYGLPFYQIPTFGDLDGDGDDDMIVGGTDGNVHYFENIAGQGNVCDFQLSLSNLNGIEDDGPDPNLHPDTINISAASYSAPKIIDLNRDGLLDLVLGRKDGKLSYFENIGTLNNFVFRHRTDNLGNVNTTEYLDVSGYSVPEFVNYNGEYHLFLGNKAGRLYYYNDIDNNITGNFNLVDSIALGIQESEYTGVAIGELFENKPYTMMIGTARGGIKLYQNTDGINIGIEELTEATSLIKVYPNPTKNILTIDDPEGVISNYQLYNLSGQIVQQGQLNGINKIAIGAISNGLYILQLRNNETIIYSKKVIKE